MFFPYFCQKLCQKGCFLYYCPSPNQSPATKGVFLYFCSYSKEVLQQRVVYCIIALNTLSGTALVRIPKPCQKGCFFFILPRRTIKRILIYFCPCSSQSPTKKGVLLYFCPYNIQSPTKRGVLFFYCPYSNQSPTKSFF